jgi:glutathione S-transferase
MTITITAFERSPDGGKGLARDTRVRWALEEVGQPYEVRLVSFHAMKEPAHRALHPFGQIPTYEEGDLALFETGVIVFHVAERHAGLLPDDANARARAVTWMFAALDTVERPILERESARLLEGDKAWYEQRLPLVEDRVRDRLDQLSGRLGDADWLDGAFSAGDLMMVSVLLRLKSSGMLDEYPNLAAYVARGEARPRLQAGFRRSIGGLQATDRLIEAVLGSKSSSEFSSGCRNFESGPVRGTCSLLGGPRREKSRMRQCAVGAGEGLGASEGAPAFFARRKSRMPRRMATTAKPSARPHQSPSAP